MIALGPLLPLFAAAGILLAGNGLQGTFITLRAAMEGFPPWAIGLMGTTYYAGFITACIYGPRLIKAVGHIRVFAALAALAAAGTLALVLIVDAYAWMAIRYLMGFCFAGLFTVVESWLNENARNQDRGRLLSVYRLVDLGAVTGGQFLLPIYGAGGFALFAITAIMFCISLVPVSLSNRSRPKAPESFRFDLGAIWRIAPLACIGCFTIGLTNSAFRLIGPLYAEKIGLDVTGVALFMSAGIVGGATLQFPFGLLSDRASRRVALGVATAGATFAGLFLSLVADGSPALTYAGALLFGAFAMPLYSLSAAHANDRAEPGQYVLIAAGLMFFFSLGAMAGPSIASLVIELFGARALFLYTSVVHGLLVVVTLWRIAIRPGVPAQRRTRFVTLLRTSPMIFRLARRANHNRSGHKRDGRKQATMGAAPERDA